MNNHIVAKRFLPWQIKDLDFSEKTDSTLVIKQILRYAILAPSSHNTQPWLFKISDMSVVVCVNSKRQLKISDTNNRELFLSIGCCIENIFTAASHFGYKPELKFHDQINQYNHLLEENKIVARIDFVSVSDLPRLDLFDQIANHRMNKFDYLLKEIPENFINDSKNIASVYGGQVEIFQDRERVKTLAEFAAEGTKKAFTNSSFRKELSGWVRNNYDQRCDGMPAYTVGMPGPVSLLGPWVISHFDIGSGEARKAAHAVNNSGGVGVICASGDTPTDWVIAGRIYQAINLLALSNGLSMAIMGAPIEIDEVNEKLKSFIGSSARPLIFFRLGYAKRLAPLSPRISLDNCII